MRRQERHAADERSRRLDEQAAEVRRLQQDEEEVRRLQQLADEDEVGRLQLAQAAADELAAQAIIDAEITESLRIADELFRAEAAEENEATIAAAQRLADEAAFQATSASWAAEQLLLSQLDQDRSDSATALALAAAQIALEQQAAEQTLILHATHKGKAPAVAGDVSNNSWAVRNGGRGISGIVAANGPVSVSYGVAVATDVTGVCTRFLVTA